MFGFTYKDLDIAHKLDKPSSPTEEYYKHIHPFWEILYLVRGNVEYTVESETKKLCEGDLVFIPYGKYHFATVDLSVPYERYVLKFPDSAVPDYVKNKLMEGSAFFTNSKKFGMVFSNLDAYIGNFTDIELYTLCICDIVKLIVLLYHEIQPSSKRNEFIDELIGYIDENIDKPITMPLLTETFHYSRSHINNEFKKYMRIPIMQYVRSKKIIAAYHMILSGMKKNETAEKFGFETYSTFYRAYKKFMKDNNMSEISD